MKISSRVIEDAIKAKTDNLPSDPADDSDIDSQLATIDGIVDNILADTATLPASFSTDTSGTFSYLDAGGEQDVVEIAPILTRWCVHGIWLDLVNMTVDGTIKVYYKIDGSNYRQFYSHAFTVATDPDGVFLNLNIGITADLKVTYEEGDEEGAARDIPYSIIYTRLE